MSDTKTWNSGSFIWLYQTKKEPSTITQFLSTLFATMVYLCCIPPKKEKCGRCLEGIRPIEGSSKIGCNPHTLHVTCDCFIQGNYFRSDINQTKIWRESPKKQVERFIENFCCIRAAAITTLPNDKLDSIIEAMNKPCDCNKDMYTCNASCCGPTSSCMRTLLDLYESTYCGYVSLKHDQLVALKNIVNEK